MAARNDMTDPDERPVSVASVRVDGLTLDSDDAAWMAWSGLSAALDFYEFAAMDGSRGEEAVWLAYQCAGEWLASCVRLCRELGASVTQLRCWTGLDASALADVLTCWPCVPGTFGPEAC
jgi:hypothetical protein